VDSELAERGIAALKAGNKALARWLLKQAIMQGANDERTWLAMSEAVEDVEHAIDCLRRALKINPGNRQAQSRLNRLLGSAGVQAHSPASQPHPTETLPSATGRPTSERGSDTEATRGAVEVPGKERDGRGRGSLPGEGPFYLFLLAWSLIWVGGNGFFLAFGIKSYLDEPRPSHIWTVVVPTVSIVIGFVAIWAMWSQRRGDRKAVLETATSRARLFGQTPQAAPDASTAQGALRCEKCGRPLGPALLDCPYRPQGTCPYQVEHPTVRQRNLYWVLLILGSSVASLGLLLTGPILGAAAEGDRSPLCLVSACATPLGLLAVVFGGMALFGEQLTFTNAETGQMWKRYRIGGLASYQATASALQPVALPPELRRPMNVPASICALYQSQNATHVFYMALLSLLSQGFVTLQCTTISRKYFGIEIPPLSGRGFALVPGKAPSPAQVAGELEKRILDAVGEWSQRTDETIRYGGSFRRRDFRHFLALEDLVYVVFEGEHISPDLQLTDDVVGTDATRQGLGRMVGPLKARFEPLPECRERVLAEYDVILDVHNRFKASQAGIASELWARIEKHIERLEPADSS
jgi:hypothetical protein